MEEQEKTPVKRKRASAKATPPEILTLDYNLAELPSAQHRAGLAGLVLMVQHLQRQGLQAAVLRLTRLDEAGLTLECDLPGLWRLFDELYAASWEEQAESQIRKNRDKQPVPPKREEPRESVDAKGKVKRKTVYIYDVVLPAGRLLRELDPSHDERGPWLKLWRDLVWGVLRGVPATCQPFEERADRQRDPPPEPTVPRDAQEAWDELTQAAESAVDLPSTYYLGAQATTAENVPFKDRARSRFLLHFWPYAVSLYVPRVLGDAREGRLDYVGYCIAIPDVAQLATFCEDWRYLLQRRRADLAGHRPREALIDLTLQGALDLALRLRQALRDRVAQRTGRLDTASVVLGYELYHLNKEGNNVRLLSSSRCEPDDETLDDYQGYEVLKDHLLRRQVLSNLVAGRLWWAGFDRLAAIVPCQTQLIGSPLFRNDVRFLFQRKEPSKMSKPEDAQPLPIELLVRRVVNSYVSRRVESKYGLEWAKAKGSEEETGKFNEARRRIAMAAFLAVRSRKNSDFVNYFAEVLCSVKQPLGNDGEFAALAQALQHQTDAVRTLTLLALSGNG